jgi:hypothetical protein
VLPILYPILRVCGGIIAAARIMVGYDERYGGDRYEPPPSRGFDGEWY